MKVILTEGQAKQLVVNVVNASEPMGMGFLHVEDKDYTKDDVVDLFKTDSIYIDCFHGRMVKFNMRKESKDSYVLPDNEPRSDYQSWCRKYPSYQSLVDSVSDLKAV